MGFSPAGSERAGALHEIDGFGDNARFGPQRWRAKNCFESRCVRCGQKSQRSYNDIRKLSRGDIAADITSTDAVGAELDDVVHNLKSKTKRTPEIATDTSGCFIRLRDHTGAFGSGFDDGGGFQRIELNDFCVDRVIHPEAQLLERYKFRQVNVLA